MQRSAGPLDEAIREIDQLRKHLRKLGAKQITASADCSLIRAYSLAWTNNHKVQVQDLLSGEQFAQSDALYQRLLTATYRATSRGTYLGILKALREELLQLQRQALAKSNPSSGLRMPDISKLVQNAEMAGLIQRRAHEVVETLDKAPLAASIMMGALLEALFLARINVLPEKRRLFSLKSTPRDKSGKARELKEWGLNDFIEVSHEMGWIRKPLKDISTVLRDYRNVIHPVKELALMMELETDVLVNADDAKMFWRVFCELSEQIASSVKP
jgi:hypothetical protein